MGLAVFDRARSELFTPPIGIERRTRFDLPDHPLSLADARLAMANYTLAECLRGEMVLVRYIGVSSAMVEEHRFLLRWLGVAWADVEVGEPAPSPPSILADRAPAGRLWQRIWEDQRLGISHAVVTESADELKVVSERVAQAAGWRPIGYLALGPTEFGDDVPLELAWYREQGYLPEAVRDVLVASTCWPTPPAEPAWSEILARFRAGCLSRSPWRPDQDWLAAAGRRAMRQAGPERMIELLRSRLMAEYGRWHRAMGTSHTPEQWLEILGDAVRQESACLEEAVQLAAFAFDDRVNTMTAEALAALEGAHVRPVLEECLVRISPVELETPERAARFFQNLRHHFRDTLRLRGREVMFPIRAALAGSMRGPCLGIEASLLGGDRCRDRLRAALERRHIREGSRLG